MDQKINNVPGRPSARPPTPQPSTTTFMAENEPAGMADAREDSRGDKLATRIARVVKRRTAGSVQNLRVEVGRDGVFLDGECDTFYTKQLAQQAAMDLADEKQLMNRIEVR